MPVRSLLVPAAAEQPVALAAVLHGIEADLVERADGEVYIDLIGSDEKMDRVLFGIIKAGHNPQVLDVTDSVPHDEPVYTMVGRKGFDD